MTCHHLFFPVYSVTHSVRRAVRPLKPLVWTHKVPAVYVVFTYTYFFALSAQKLVTKGLNKKAGIFSITKVAHGA